MRKQCYAKKKIGMDYCGYSGFSRGPHRLSYSSQQDWQASLKKKVKTSYYASIFQSQECGNRGVYSLIN
jgi:hypothetical protein